ncbi:hypothetical protein [Flavobacterium marginilacus]|uniref:hypothetical protein n=1 Tax=Flavobacterium marginilacus TaxID=3003256 RepID=UPI00248D7574|nr:hypothetical protein [Flavobacterium marginilacus]
MELQNTNELDDVAVLNNTSGSFTFRTPAGIQDFPNDPAKQTAMNSLWSSNLDEFTQQGMLSNPWNSTNTPSVTNYYNPIQNNPKSSTYPVLWFAFPGRLHYNFPNANQDQLNEMADTGNMPSLINNNPCGTPTQTIPYFPYGPRGWQDEYCEWAVTRNSKNQITRIDFTCENPEYWNSLWLVDPNKVVSLYQSVLNKPQITLADLSLSGAVNPITGGPVYNPLNKWNSGTVSSETTGGAIHLTSTPNTLQTEIGLATAATVQRNNPSGTTGNTVWPQRLYNNLLCDAQYGQKNRNSDPTIGGNVNNLVNGILTANVPQVATLADPPGLYIQMPDFTNYKTPDGTDASAFWKIVRGSKTLNDQYGNPMPGNFILHAVFEVPADKNYTVSDIKINGQPIQWGSQIASTFQMQIVASAYATSTQPIGYDAVGSKDPAFAQPLQLFYADYFNAMYSTMVPNPVNHPISLLSNSTFIPPTLFKSANGVNMVLISDTCTAVPGDSSTYPKVTFDDANITAVVNSVQTGINYAVPGNSMPGSYTALFITVNVGLNTAAGPHGIYITNSGQSQSTAMPALLTVAPTTIQANVKWQNTGVMVTPGIPVNIAYQNGLWTANPNDNGGRLYNAAGNPSYITAKPGYTMPGQNEGALIGQVSGTVFFVGMGATVPNNVQGELQLCINDDLDGIYGVGFADNIGSISVTVTIGQ